VIEERFELLTQINLGRVTQLSDIPFKMMLDLREELARVYHYGTEDGLDTSVETAGTSARATRLQRNGCESLLLSVMEIQLTPEQENLLAQLATDKGKAVDALATEEIRHYLDDQTRFIAA